MNKITKQFVGEVYQYFKALNAYTQGAGVEHHKIMTRLTPRLLKNSKKLLADEQHKPHAEQDRTPTIAELLPRKELVDLLFTDTKSRQRYLSRNPTNLINRCDHLGMPHKIILILEREGWIEKISNADQYQRCKK